MMAILNSLSFRLYIFMSSVLVSAELSFSFWPELLLQFLMVFHDLIFFQGICVIIRLQIPPDTSRGKQKQSFWPYPLCEKLWGTMGDCAGLGSVQVPVWDVVGGLGFLVRLS